MHKATSKKALISFWIKMLFYDYFGYSRRENYPKKNLEKIAFAAH